MQRPQTSSARQIYTDFQGALAQMTGISEARTKHIDVHYHNGRGLHQRKVVKHGYANIDDNPADILTKALPRENHEKVTRAVGLWQGRQGLGRLELYGTQTL